ncbi:MAG: BREX system P-loop protein BrxC [Chloroflexota bacterium]|nr:BREX system P-loop protein BrxC [Chloroflexota bacterium]
MQIRDLFLKPIDREIEGVIKVDDLETLKIEVEEYVITNEIAQKLLYLLEQYSKPTMGNNGVWISGFFGSGKSHLLKILALLLENREINGISVLDTLLEKVSSSDAILKAEIKKAVAIPSKSILFNIDQKASAISKSDFDAVLGVFAKVFDEFCGYYGQQGYIAKFERDLDEQGLFGDFRKHFEDIAGISWHEGRENFNLNRRKIAQAFARTTDNPEESSVDIIKSYREDYKLSIEDFANNVNEYIQKQEKGFRLNFFVDEVGQYIAENVKLMTNLQTIAESLATICKGQAWLFVTSQDDMTTVLGDFGQKQSNDFSKIQARFKSQMHLSSQDVAEVIQKRLLKKNEDGVDAAQTLYDREHKNFGTIFKFPDGGMSFKGFRDEQHFVSSYPFIPYQYTLFQQSIESLSKHNAFTGKHNSVGERSMLGVFQDVVKEIADRQVDSIGSFDMMYEGIRNSIKSRNQSSIFYGEEHLNNPFALKLLKVLFLVKYVKGFRATPRNLRVLMQTDFDEDIRALENKIQQALSVLERETYIQRNEDTYEYLTEEEHDVEVEIKNQVVENEVILKFLEDVFFAEIIRDNKIRYEDNQQDYSFAKMIDEKLRGKDRELSIDVITPFSDFNDNLTVLKSHAMGKPVLTIVLPPDPKFQQDVFMYKKTETYIKQTHGSQTSETKNMILTNKAYSNQERKKAISNRARQLVGQANLLVSGDAVEIGGEDAKTRVVKGFNALIEKVYPNLRMLGGVQYREEDILHYLEASQDSLFGGDPTTLNEAELDMLTTIKNNKTRGELTTMKKIEDKYTSRPYGWYLAAIQCVTAQLAGRRKIECWQDGNLLENSLLEKALRNTYNFSNLTISPVKSVPGPIISALKGFIRDFFNEPTVHNEAHSLVKSIREKMGELKDQLEGFYHYRSRYPFISQLQPITQRIDSLLQNNYEYFTSVNGFPEDVDGWLELKEEEIDPLVSFMKGHKQEIFDQLVDFVNQNKPDFTNGELAKLQTYLEDPKIYIGNRLRQARTDMEAIRKALESRLLKARQTALEKIDELQESMHQMEDFQKLDQSDQQRFDQSFEQIRYTIQSQSLSVSIRDKVEKYDVNEYSTLLTKVKRLVNPPKVDDGDDEPPLEVQVVHVSSLNIPAPKKILEDEDDVEEYCDILEETMLKAIRDNKHINI